MNKVDELCKELEKEADIEEVSFGDGCPKSYDGFDCTRPAGHSGYHIAMGIINNRIFFMWHEDLSE